jgi:hypothetical protein
MPSPVGASSLASKLRRIELVAQLIQSSSPEPSQAAGTDAAQSPPSGTSAAGNLLNTEG